ncbi:MAG: hypothetical protein ACTHNK_00405 [Thermomicrobiales bacterium]
MSTLPRPRTTARRRPPILALVGIVALSLTLSFTALLPTATPLGAAPPAANIAHLCQLLLANPAPENAGLTQGACVAYLTAGNNTAILASICRLPDGVAEAELLSGRPDLTHGQCVVVLQAFTAAP